MVRVFARQHCVRLKCSVCSSAAMRNRGSQWSQRLRTAVGVYMLAQAGPASRCKCFKRWQKALTNPRPGDFAVQTILQRTRRASVTPRRSL